MLLMVFRGLSVGVIIRLTNQNVRYILTFTLVIAASKSDEKWESYPKKKQKIANLTGKNFFFDKRHSNIDSMALFTIRSPTLVPPKCKTYRGNLTF